jgi:type IX secretion system PorP/SprF family membrane protein
MGFEGAPMYNVLGIHAPLRNTKMAGGLLVMNESRGLRKCTGFYLNYAYRMLLGRGKLSMGLKGGILNGGFETLDLGEDVVFSEKTSHFLLPNFGFGAYYYSSKFRLGLSVPLMMSYKTNDAGEVIPYHSFAQYAYYLTTALKINLVQNWQIEPSGLIQYNKAGSLIADAGLGLLFKDVLKAGFSYRTSKAAVLLIDYKINPQLRAGIAYDYGFGKINDHNRNSFELAIEYNFGYQIRASNPTIF